jgi:ATP-dependent DNA ligase
MQHATFIETMDCLLASKLPEGPERTYEIKLDGYRLEAVKSNGEVTLYSHRQSVLDKRFPYIAEALVGQWRMLQTDRDFEVLAQFSGLRAATVIAICM